MCCLGDYTSLKHKKFYDQKDFEAKKNESHATNNNNKNGGQSDQALGCFSPKNSCSNKRDKQDQSFNTPATSNNVTVIKKIEKQDYIDLS